MIFAHDGDIGDLIAALSVVRYLGGGELVLYPTGYTRERMTRERFESIRDFLGSQPYLSSVSYADSATVGCLNLGHWRKHYANGLNLCDMYYHWLGSPHPDRYEPWLWFEPTHKADVIFARSPRYHGNFPWRRAIKKYRDCCLFLGHTDEHQAFCREFGEVPYRSTTFAEAARIIAGARLVCVNQTGLYWVAEAQKKVICLEASGNWGQRTCHWERNGFFYGSNGLCELPDVEAFDDAITSVCAHRDSGRSLLTEDRREQLARIALSCSHLPGDVAEVGVFRGGSANIIAAALPDKTLYLFDTFAGHPADETLSGGHKQGEFATSLDDVRDFLMRSHPKRFEPTSNGVCFAEGVFPDSAKAVCSSDQCFCFIHLDADLYQSTKDALDFFWPRLVEGGAIVLDDWGMPDCPGVIKAVADARLSERVQRTTRFQAVIRK